jgi:lipopolysaccharide export system protein LptC
MSGSVLISSSTGYQLSTPVLLVSTDGTYIQGNGPVEGFTPMGKIQAGKIEIKRENTNSPMQLWFSEKVMIDYEPQKI